METKFHSTLSSMGPGLGLLLVKRRGEKLKRETKKVIMIKGSNSSRGYTEHT